MEKIKFVVVSEGRTGSNFLVSILENHPSIRVYSELFNRSDYKVMEYLDEQGCLIKLGEDPIDFLETKIFNNEFPVVGFKLMYHQAKSQSWNKIWTYVRRNFRVIHLKRRNLLDRFLSLKLAIENNCHVSYENQECYTKSVYIDPIELQNAIEVSLKGRKECEIIFKHTPCLEVWYEDICEDYENHIEVIQDFLGVVPKDLKPTTIKQRTESQSMLIDNYEELRQYFLGKSHEGFFTG